MGYNEATAAPRMQEQPRDWFCSATSLAWVCRLESLICVLDCEECGGAALCLVMSFLLLKVFFLHFVRQKIKPIIL